MEQENSRLPKILWLWLPLLVFIAQLIAEATLPPPTLLWLTNENGPHELGQFGILVIAFFVILSILPGFPVRRHAWLAAWVILAAICTFYVAGEEESWGQWFFHWPTPEQWAEINKQHETNLHNTSSWLNEKPRLLLELGVIVGGLVIPALQRFRPALLPKRFDIIYPPAIVAVTAGIYFFFKASDAIVRVATHRHLYMRSAEVQETFMYWFTLLYVLVLRQRLKPLKVRAASISQ